MAVSSCNKEVATRLFRMLAVNEQTVTTVKRDHASYAKLSLLTQQAQLLQRQAVQVVNKSAARAGELNIGLVESCTALSSDFDDGAKRLLGVLAVNEQTALAISTDAAASAKLSLLAGQVGLLQEQAQQVIDEADLNRHLSEIYAATAPGCRLVTGTFYYHYTQNGQEVLSRISETEWSAYETYHGKYLYDFDFAFRKHVEELEDEHEGMELCPSAAAPTTRALGLAEDMAEERLSPEPTGRSVPTVEHAEQRAFAPVCGVLSRW